MDVIRAHYTSDRWHHYRAYTEILEYTVGKPYIKSIIHFSKNTEECISTGIHTEYRDGIFHMLDGISFAFDPSPF